MSSLKMKVKKVIFLIMIFVTSAITAGIVNHTMISISEQKMLGHLFKHVMTSGNADKDEFFIDGRIVSKEKYSTEFERLQKKEWEDIAMQQEKQQRSRVQFSEMMQVEVAAKLLHKVVAQTSNLLNRAHNPSLEKFFVFSHATIDSLDQLNQLKLFLDQVQDIMKQLVENNDFQGLNVLYTKLEFWPARLEKFFQDTVQQAIRQSDDTAMLKELLTLVSEPFSVG